MKTYTIKPLVDWGKNGVLQHYHETICGTYYVVERAGTFYWSPPGGGRNDCTSICEGKSKAESHYASHLSACLEEQPEHPAVALLRDIQWSGTAIECMEEYSCCPECGGLMSTPSGMHLSRQGRYTVGHAPDCRLNAIINPPKGD